MPTALSRNELFLISALRDVLPQFRLASDEMMQRKLADRLWPATEEIVCLLESAGCNMQKDVVARTLISQAIAVLADYMKREMQLTVTLKTILDCLSLAAVALEKRYPYAIKWQILAYEIIPNYSTRMASPMQLAV